MSDFQLTDASVNLAKTTSASAMLFFDIELQFGDTQTQMKETMVTHLAEVGITTTVDHIAIGEEPKKESYNRRSVAMVAELGGDC